MNEVQFKNVMKSILDDSALTCSNQWRYLTPAIQFKVMNRLKTNGARAAKFLKETIIYPIWNLMSGILDAIKEIWNGIVEGFRGLIYGKTI